ncbi:MAG: type II 3-dehydroquinate dehydratase [bacterium]|nr:type II 3-dehydroquinate dehydratase [bacterium]
MSGKILLINGPNLNLLGQREPEIYGSTNLAQIEAALKAQIQAAGFSFEAFQSNHEGELIDFVQQQGPKASFGIVNAGALTHTSLGLRDALKGVALPFVELHVSNVYAREPFRHHSYLSDIAQGVVAGLGVAGYGLAAQYVIDCLKEA